MYFGIVLEGIARGLAVMGLYSVAQQYADKHADSLLFVIVFFIHILFTNLAGITRSINRMDEKSRKRR
jgi:hypothetical protein